MACFCPYACPRPPFYQDLGKATGNKPLNAVNNRKPVRTGDVLGDTLRIPKPPNLLESQPEPQRGNEHGLTESSGLGSTAPTAWTGWGSVGLAEASVNKTEGFC